MLNILLIVTGGVIGFFSICFRRILSAIIGFIWGAGFGVLISFLIGLNSGLGTGGYVIISLIIATIMAILSYKYYSFFVFLNTFLVSFVIFFVIVLLATNFNLRISIPIAIVLAIIAGIVSTIIYDPLFIISTAFLGGSLMSLGGVSLSRGTDFIRLIGGIIWSGSGLNQVVIWTIILSIVGIIVQFLLLNKLNIGGDADNSYKDESMNKTETEYPVDSNGKSIKKCRQCGSMYYGSYINCPQCKGIMD
jgi:hypothetical protein